jgi:hypothetical protein
VSDLPENQCELLLKAWLQDRGRGAAVTLCVHTSLSESEISNWLAQRRALTPHKLVEAISWLINSGEVSVCLT